MQKHSELPSKFKELGVEVRFLKALQKMGFEEPSQIQLAMIPPAMEGRDILGQARTGTGKTAAFGLPILQKIDPGARLQAICLAPTRELAVQVTGELRRLAAFAGLHIVTIYGGQRVATQLHELGKKPHFVVGTPGRIMDFMGRGVLDIRDVRFVVLDEVDRMLDIGFRDDIRKILSTVHGDHQTMFVSATLSDEIRRLTQRYMNDAVSVNVSKDKMTVDEVDQSYISVEPYDKFRLLKLVLERENPPVCIVFTNTKAVARKLASKLAAAGENVQEIHGDLMQRKRDRVMEQFRKHQIRILIATDLAARGLDVSAVTHIINYDLPQDPEVYVHRIGRTARMGARGTAVTFVTSEQGRELTTIEMLINREVPVQTIDGFVSKPRSQEPAAPAKPPGPTRLEAPVHSSNLGETAKAPPKTLGSRFKTKRRRRL